MYRQIPDPTDMSDGVMTPEKKSVKLLFSRSVGKMEVVQSAPKVTVVLTQILNSTLVGTTDTLSSHFPINQPLTLCLDSHIDQCHVADERRVERERHKKANGVEDYAVALAKAVDLLQAVEYDQLSRVPQVFIAQELFEFQEDSSAYQHHGAPEASDLLHSAAPLRSRQHASASPPLSMGLEDTPHGERQQAQGDGEASASDETHSALDRPTLQVVTRHSEHLTPAGTQ